MLPNARELLIVSFVSFASNWQFGYQVTYVNNAGPSFYELSNQAYQRHNHNNSSDGLSYDTWSGKESIIDNPYYSIPSEQWSLIVASFYPGTFLGFTLVPFLIRTVGVKHSLLYS